jgi:hypothetical protein
MTHPTTAPDRWALIFSLAAFGNLAIGLWMLADPVGWYHATPGVPGSGPLTEHFGRDVGATFTTLGLALVWGARRPALRVPMLALVTLFHSAHALVHVLDTVRGLFPAGQWGIDAPLIYLPTALLLLALGALARRTSVP